MERLGDPAAEIGTDDDVRLVDDDVSSAIDRTGYVFANPPPWQHQRDAFDRFKDDPYCAIFYEQRVGKTRTATDICGYRYENGTIDAVLIIAWPNGVHRAWISEEIPNWLPVRIPRRGLIWRSGKHSTRAFKQEFDQLLRSKGLAILSVNAEAITTKACKEHIKEFLRARRGVALIVDECDWASSPGSARTETVVKMATWQVIKLKMLLGGTPATESPFQLFSQMNILKPDFFGFKTFQTFKHHFGVYDWEPAPVQVPLITHGRIQRFKNGRVILTDKLDDVGNPVIAIDKRTGKPKMRPVRGLNHTTNSQFEAIKRDETGTPLYRNLDELHEKMAHCTVRVLRRDVSDAPEPVHSKHFYEMSKEQYRVYSELLEEFRTELRSGYIVEAAHVLTRWLRLQQVLSNLLPPREEGLICGDCDGGGCAACDDVGIIPTIMPAEVVDMEADPRLDALRFIIRESPDKTIVWCRFQHEVTAVIAAVAELGHTPVRFDGQVPEADRRENLQEFRRGRADFLIGNAAAGGRGLPMDVADLAVFYSNYFSGRTREQVEARTEALFKQTPTSIVDIICEDTIDEKIVAVLRAKKSLSHVIMRDNLGSWL
jgi:hypothetical protein